MRAQSALYATPPITHTTQNLKLPTLYEIWGPAKDNALRRTGEVKKTVFSYKKNLGAWFDWS